MRERIEYKCSIKHRRVEKKKTWQIECNTAFGQDYKASPFLCKLNWMHWTRSRGELTWHKILIYRTYLCNVLSIFFSGFLLEFPSSVLENFLQRSTRKFSKNDFYSINMPSACYRCLFDDSFLLVGGDSMTREIKSFITDHIWGEYLPFLFFCIVGLSMFYFGKTKLIESCVHY